MKVYILKLTKYLYRKYKPVEKSYEIIGVYTQHEIAISIMDIIATKKRNSLSECSKTNLVWDNKDRIEVKEINDKFNNSTLKFCFEVIEIELDDLTVYNNYLLNNNNVKI